MKTTLTGIVAIALLVIISLPVSAQTPTRIQVLFTPNISEAESMVAKINNMGYGPGEIRAVEGGYKVLTCLYDSYAEANFAKSKLKGMGYTDAFSVREESKSKQNVIGNPESVIASKDFTRLPIDFETSKRVINRPEMTDELYSVDNNLASEEVLFRKCRAFSDAEEADKALDCIAAFLRRFPDSSNIARVEIIQAYWYLKKGDRKTALEKFKEVAEKYTDKTESGEANLRCAYLMRKAGEPIEKVLQRFKLVAAGEVPSEPDVRVDAMLRCAALYHKGRDIDTAEEVYKAIEKITPDPEVKAFAQMHRAGILMEKAWNDKGTFADCRNLCDDLLARYPKVNKQTRATAALMAMESLCYEDNYKGAVLRAGDFMEEFGDVKETPLGYYWIAKAYLETGNTELAVKILEDLIGADINIEDRFKYLNLTRSARKLASRAYTEIGDIDKANKVLEE